MRAKCVIFDLDGTILDTLEDLADTLNVILAENDLPSRSMEEIRSFVGNGLHKLVERAVPKDCPEALIEKVFQEYVPYYKANCAVKTRPYDRIEELLRALRRAGVRTAVVSNKKNEAVQELCQLYFPGLFDLAVGEREEVRAKPAPDSVKAVLQKLKFQNAEAVYVGDSEVDIETAANAHIRCISVTWGFRSAAFLLDHGAKAMADSVEELAGLL